MDASFAPDEVAQARVFFRPEGIPTWYYVKMTRATKGYEGVLPKPKKKLIGTKIVYYIEATAKDLGQGTTEETDPRVVASKDDCRNEPVAAFSTHPPVAVFPNVPAGFAVGGAAAPIVGTGLAVAAAGGTVLATRSKNEPAPQAPPPTTPPPQPPPTPPTPPTPTPPGDPCANNQPPRGDFDISPNPPAGLPPLEVRFNNCRSTDPESDPILFSYDFGDGTGDADPGTPCRLDHTYARPGTYGAVVCVGDACRPRASCKRYTVSVEAPTKVATLSVATVGSGSGTVSGTGIACPGDCSESFTPGMVVTLTAAAGSGSFFSGWSGDVPASCAGTPLTCTITMDANKSVVAGFGPTFNLNLGKVSIGGGTGTVTDDQAPQQINCGPTCSNDSGNYTSGTNVTLTATASGASEFCSWGGDVPVACAPVQTEPCFPAPPPSCTIPMDANKNVTAVFVLPSVFLDLSKAGTGTGTVTDDQGQINCGPACSGTLVTYSVGTTVTLTAAAGANSTFTGWGGPDVPASCISRIPPLTCTVPMNTDKAIVATFDLVTFTLTVAKTPSGVGTVDDGAAGQINCGTTCSTDSGTYASGTAVTLTATGSGDCATSGFCVLSWSGDVPANCTGCPSITGTCPIDMTTNKAVTVTFTFCGLGLTDSPPGKVEPLRPPREGLRWSSQLDLPGATLQLMVNDDQLVLVGAGRVSTVIGTRPGENRIEARVLKAGSAGTWRFELEDKGAIEPGSLHVLSGDVLLVTSDSVVFRLRGRTDERLAIAFMRSRDTARPGAPPRVP
jgi:hypothetical protein